MPRKSILRPRILKAAISLFAWRGRHGVTKDSLIEAAGISKGSMKRLYPSLDKLCAETVLHVTTRLREELAAVPGCPFHEDLHKSLAEAACRWYYALPQDAARLLQQVMMHDRKNRNHAYEPLKQFVGQLAAILERLNSVAKISAKNRAENLMWSLFHYKVTLRPTVSQAEEFRAVAGKIQHWIEDSVTPNRRSSTI